MTAQEHTRPAVLMRGRGKGVVDTMPNTCYNMNAFDFSLFNVVNAMPCGDAEANSAPEWPTEEIQCLNA
jgi:hypothetical protein